MRRIIRQWLVPLLALMYSCAAADQVGIGFCLDQVPAALVDTGFASVSAVRTQAACQLAGHEWCPLVNITRTWTPPGASAPLEYYWYSGCCTGKLLSDSAGLPTCESGTPAEECTRSMWQTKLSADLLGEDSGYSFDYAPSTFLADSATFGKDPLALPCMCQPTDPQCQRTNAAGTLCLVCETNEMCSSDAAVHIGITFLKIVDINLESSGLDFSVWFSSEWRDYRLNYDYQCYGGIDKFDVQTQTGDLENNRIWSPDFELINSNVPIWGAMTPRLAIAYSCQDDTPSRASCGRVEVNVPGVMQALCRYDGLVMFPYDTLRCDLEFSAWTLPTHVQDLVLKSDGDAVSWIDKPGTNPAFGMTAGSRFQDFRFVSLTAKRMLALYEGATLNRLFPTFIYTIKLKRSEDYYVSKLVVPMIVIGGLSFIVFWMRPDVGERLGFGIISILALVANDLTAMTVMPVCDEFSFLNFLSLGCQGFSWVALLETAVVLYLFHMQEPNWYRALVPKWFRAFLSRRRIPAAPKHQSHLKRHARDDKDMFLRHQLYRRIFTSLDSNSSGLLDFEELDLFGAFTMGDEWDTADHLAFLLVFQKDGKYDAFVDFEEFVTFCDTRLKFIDDTSFLRKTVDGFLTYKDRRAGAVKELWRQRAEHVDAFSRWVVPLCYVVFVAILYSQDEDSLNNKSTDVMSSTVLLLIPFILMAVLSVVWSGFLWHQEHLYFRKARTGDINFIKDDSELEEESSENRSNTDGVLETVQC